MHANAKIETKIKIENRNGKRTLFFFPGFLVFAAEGIGTVAIESETIAETLDSISDKKEIRKNPSL